MLNEHQYPNAILRLYTWSTRQAPLLMKITGCLSLTLHIYALKET